MPPIRALTVCVGSYYADLLRITLPRNARHFAETWVVTSPDDDATRAVALSVPGVRVFETDAFTRPDANGIRPRMNKGHAIEECFQAMGRDGWFAVWDADCIWPDSPPLDQLNPACLHGAKRRILEDPAKWHPDFNWQIALPVKDGGPIGHTQIFHADAIRGKPVWYDVSFAHAGGGDAFFMNHWPRHLWKILPMEVLHLGPNDRHWWGTDPEAVDIMARFVTDNGWGRAAAKFTPEQVARAGEFTERVEVPGYAPSSFELPFCRRARQERERRGNK